MELPPLITSTRASAPLPPGELGLVSLAKELQGLQLSAVVKNIIELHQSQRELLIQTLSREPQVLNPQQNLLARSPSGTPGRETLEGMLQAVKLNLLLLQIQPAEKLPQSVPRLLQVLSPVEIKPGVGINVRVRTDGNLQLESLSSTATHKGPAIEQPGFIPTRNEVLNKGLRQYLPFDQSISKNITLIQNVAKQLHTLPLAQREQLTDKGLLQALTPFIKTTPQIVQNMTLPQRVALVQTLKTSLQQSGPFLEQNLSKLTTNTSKPDALPEVVKQVELIKGEIRQDTKATLLEIFSQSHGHRAGTAQAKAPPSLQQLLQSAASNLRQAEPLLNMLNQQSLKSAGKLDIGNIREQLARVLQSAAALGLARVSANQIRLLLSAEGTAAPLSFDIPLRTQEGFLPLFLQLQQFPLPDDKQEQSSKKNNKRKQQRVRWQIYMEMQLQCDDDSPGNLAAEISLVDHQVKTRLWCDSDTLKNRAGERIGKLKQILEKNGLEVDELVVEQGKPPGKQQSIAQNLIDIRT